jgi:demethylmenaquinone methyltransferase/2-methoxy-6-polyprenyl-1,4-benzoquinol methylase
MAYLNGSEREKFVNQTFTDIAPRYVFMNHLMTGGMDVLLRKEAVHAANLRTGERVLDLGTGTGDLARDARNRHGRLKLTAADFTLAMMTATKD